MSFGSHQYRAYDHADWPILREKRHVFPVATPSDIGNIKPGQWEVARAILVQKPDRRPGKHLLTIESVFDHNNLLLFIQVRGALCDTFYAIKIYDFTLLIALSLCEVTQKIQCLWLFNVEEYSNKQFSSVNLMIFVPNRNNKEVFVESVLGLPPQRFI